MGWLARQRFWRLALREGFLGLPDYIREGMPPHIRGSFRAGVRPPAESRYEKAVRMNPTVAKARADDMANEQRLAVAYNLIGPWRGACGFCGHPDARHRVADAITSRYLAGEGDPDIGEDYGMTPRDVLAVAVAVLADDVLKRRRKQTRTAC